MNVIGYCLNPELSFIQPAKLEYWIPAVPVGLITPEGVTCREAKVDRSQFKKYELAPMEVADGSWLGIEADGSPTILHPGDELEWRVSHAIRSLEEMSIPGRDALLAVYSLHTAAALIGLRLPTLQTAIQKVRKAPDEPLEVTVRALATELAKSR